MRRDWFRVLVLSIWTFSGGACASLRPQPVPPSRVAVPETFTAQADGLVAGEETTDAAWWTRFEDPVLDELVEQALRNNRSLEAQLQVVEAARAARRLRRAEQGPTGGPRVHVEARRYSTHETPASDRDVETLRVGFDAGWELDLFGRLRNDASAATARQQAAERMLEHSRLIVSAEVVRTYSELRGAESRRALRLRTREDQARLVELNDALAAEGRISPDVAARARAELRSQEAALLDEEERLARLTHALAVLVVEAPGAFRLPAGEPLGRLAVRQIAIANPTAMLRRRPDIQAAERTLAAQQIDVASASAAYFPQLRLGGFVGLVAGTGSDLGSSSAVSWFVGPSLGWGLLDLGRTHARVQAERAEARAALAEYEEAVLRALEEAENAVAAYGLVEARLRARVDQVQQARIAADAALARYEEGATDHLAALLARRDALEAEIAGIDALVTHRIAVVALFKALGAAPPVRS